MPAFGTGVLNYPRDIVAEWMFKTVSKFLEKNQNTKIEKVLFVLFDRDIQTIQAFKNYKNSHENEVEENDRTFSKKQFSDNQTFFNDLNGNTNDGYKMKFQNVIVHVYVGEITKAKDDVIQPKPI